MSNIGFNSSWITVEIWPIIWRFSSCIVVGNSRIPIISYIPTGRNSGPWGPATVQAMIYPKYENALCRSLTLYIYAPPIHIIQLCSTWHDIISFWACRLCSLSPLVGQTCFRKGVNRLYDTLSLVTTCHSALALFWFVLTFIEYSELCQSFNFQTTNKNKFLFHLSWEWPAKCLERKFAAHPDTEHWPEVLTLKTPQYLSHTES